MNGEAPPTPYTDYLTNVLWDGQLYDSHEAVKLYLKHIVNRFSTDGYTTGDIKVGLLAYARSGWVVGSTQLQNNVAVLDREIDSMQVQDGSAVNPGAGLPLVSSFEVDSNPKYAILIATSFMTPNERTSSAIKHCQLARAGAFGPDTSHYVSKCDTWDELKASGDDFVVDYYRDDLAIASVSLEAKKLEDDGWIVVYLATGHTGKLGNFARCNFGIASSVPTSSAYRFCDENRDLSARARDLDTM